MFYFVSQQVKCSLETKCTHVHLICCPCTLEVSSKKFKLCSPDSHQTYSHFKTKRNWYNFTARYSGFKGVLVDITTGVQFDRKRIAGSFFFVISRPIDKRVFTIFYYAPMPYMVVCSSFLWQALLCMCQIASVELGICFEIIKIVLQPSISIFFLFGSFVGHP